MGSGTHSYRRDGFTLIELLVVLAILSLLVGLTMAGISRVRTVQQSNSTESTLQKLQKAVEQQMNATMDQAKDAKNPYLSLVKGFADGDADRARALLAYAGSKRAFPQTFAEALNLTNSPTIPGVGPLPTNKSFSSLTGMSPGVLAPDQEAAALLYIIVHDMAARGTTIDPDGALASAEVIIPGTTLKAYKDAYGTPIAFIRWYGPYPGPFFAANNATQAAPYVNAKSPPFDPYDPLGKLLGWGNVPSKTAALTVLNANYSSPGGVYTPVLFDGFNKLVTVVSAGPDKTFGTPDDVFGYPLARFGARGD